MRFRSDLTAEITKYNPRKEIADGVGTLAGDISVNVELPVDILDQLAIDETNFRRLLYKDSGDPRALCINSLQFFREFRDMRVEIIVESDDETEFKQETILLNNCTIKKISAEIKPGFRVVLSMQVQLHPDEVKSGELHAAMLKPKLWINVRDEADQMDIEDAVA